MYHSITFGDITSITEDGQSHSAISGMNTWEDWGLIPTSRPLVNPPAPNRKTIEIPGRNGTLDMSSLLTGYMTYKNRTGSWEFVVDNKNITLYPVKQQTIPKDWQTVYSNVMAYLHGKKMKCVLEDDRAFYYEGMLSVNSWKSDRKYSSIVLDYDLDPYKRSILTTHDPWLWDPFNFETGVIMNIGDQIVEADSTKVINLPSFDEPVLPEVFCSNNNVTLLYGSHTINLIADGYNHSYPNFKIYKQSGLSNCTVRNANLSLDVVVRIIYRRGEF